MVQLLQAPSLQQIQILLIVDSNIRAFELPDLEYKKPC
jgi:hypothetical protein